MGPLDAVFGTSIVLWLSASASAAAPIVCTHCDDTTDLRHCKNETCHGIEDGCYWQVNNEHNTVRIHARCISDHTCHFPETWHGLATWKGTFLENGCCFGTHHCSTVKYIAALNKWNGYFKNHLATHPPKVHYCTVCEGESSVSQCKRHQRCFPGQNKCFIQVNSGFNGAVEIFARCTRDSACYHIQSDTWTRNNHFQVDVCQACCSGDDCNSRACQGRPSYTTSTTPATLTAPYRLSQGIDCSVCTGASCQRVGVTSKCPDAFPYCMNTVENDASGTKLITKKCASESTCQKQWWEDTSGHNICSVLDPAMTYRTTFTCSYCCLTPDCNKDVHPNPTSLFIGT